MRGLVIRAVFLDIDDTLLSFSDSERQIMRTGFERYGLPAYTDEAYRTFQRVSGGMWRQIELGELTLTELERIRWSTIFAELGISFDGVEFEAYFRRELFSSAIVVPGAPELVRYLNGRYVLCAASNGPYGQQINRLRMSSMLDLFDHVFISSELGAEKPSAEFFDACFKVLHDSGHPELVPGEAMIVGDSMTSDIAGGAAYGMQTCLYRPTGSTEPMPSPMADHVVSNLMDVTSFL